MKKLTFLIYSLLCLGIAAANAQYKDIHDFDNTHGFAPEASLVISGNKLWGMTPTGGANGDGCIFSVDTNGGAYNDVHDFSGYPGDGNNPYGSLLLFGDKLYGMTYGGGSGNEGMMFSIDTNATGYKMLMYFGSGPNYGDQPYGSLSIYNNQLYGMTYDGGITYHYGNIFVSDTNGVCNDQYNFSSGIGEYPHGSLTFSGNIAYGTLSSLGMGGIFRFNATNLHDTEILRFNGVSSPQGSYPTNDVVISGNVLYGMTPTGGGASNYGCIYSVHTDGTGYKDLLNFNLANGNNPRGSLIRIGNLLYGMTIAGGANGIGLIFSIDTNGGNYKDLYDFSNATGAQPFGSLMLSGNTLYGMTNSGGVNGDGVVFSFKLCSFSVSSSINNNVSCNGGSDGSITITPSGGASPYTYSWNGGGGSSSIISGLSAGIYTVNVLDKNECVGFTTITVTQPDVLSASASVSANASCNGGNNGNANANTNGGESPYTFSWSNGSTSNPTGAVLSAGIYTVTVHDKCGESATASVTITQPNPLSAAASILANVACNGDNGGNAKATISGGTASFTYSWSNGSTTIVSTSNPTGTVLSAGTYTITVKDSCGESATASVTITQPAPLTAVRDSGADNGTNNGFAGVVPSGGNTPYTYLWAPGGETNANITGLSAGKYCCTVTDANGCQQTTCITVKSTAGIENIESVPNKIIVYPNPNNGMFTLQLANSQQLLANCSITIYNMLGQEIYSEKLSAANTEINLSHSVSGIYLYRIIAETGGLVSSGKFIIQK